MVLPTNINDREYQNFVEIGGEVYKRVTGTFSASFTDTGLSKEGKFTVVEINAATWVLLPATALTDRNTLCIQNRSGEGMYYSFTGVDEDTFYKGWFVPNDGVQNLKITESIVIYGKSETSTVNILVQELA